MRNLSWKLAIVLLTFLIGTALAMVWITLNNKPVITVEAPPLMPEIEIPVPEEEIPEPPADDYISSPPLVSSNNLKANDESRPARRIKGGGKLCENYLLKKVAKEKAQVSKTARLKIFNSKDENFSSDLKQWLEYMWDDRLAAFEMTNKETKVLVLRSYSRAATGLSASFISFYVQFDNNSLDFQSMSENPKLIFWDKKGLLNYYLVEFGDDFMDNKDWDNLALDLLRYKVIDGKPVLISEVRNVICE